MLGVLEFLLSFRCRRSAAGWRTASVMVATAALVAVAGLAAKDGTPRLMMSRPRRQL
jgi:hypothetical protein